MKKLVFLFIMALVVSGCSTVKVMPTDERLLSGNQIGAMHYMVRKGAYRVDCKSTYSRSLTMGIFNIQGFASEDVVDFKKEFITSLSSKCYPLVDRNDAIASVNVFIRQISDMDFGIEETGKEILLKRKLESFQKSDIDSYSTAATGSTVTTEVIIAIIDIKTGKVLDLFDAVNVDYCVFSRIKPSTTQKKEKSSYGFQ